LPEHYRRTLEQFKPGPAAFKIAYALSEPIPWRASACRRASTVHLGGTLEEIASSEGAMTRGMVSERPFVLLAQPTLVDPWRAPAGKHIAWAYCHLPNGTDVDASALIEPRVLEAQDANLVGGDISGGAMTLGQTLLRPGWRGYATPDKRIFLCSASTPPGAGVHGMCGFHAARAALSSLRR
jgi:phytoene dehydrogenase-like protein